VVVEFVSKPRVERRWKLTEKTNKRGKHEADRVGFNTKEIGLGNLGKHLKLED
jgi:hypothetical protein